VRQPAWVSPPERDGRQPGRDRGQHRASDTAGEPPMILTEFPVEHVLTMTARTEQAILVHGAPQGTRGVVRVTGGEFGGGRLSGTIAACGADWFTARTDGSLLLDVRLLLACSDGASVLLAYQGVAVPLGDGGLDIRIAALFEAPQGPHAWLNRIQGVGRGRLTDGGVRYEIYALR
jgi:Protein of unknown function (DUF3237)